MSLGRVKPEVISHPWWPNRTQSATEYTFQVISRAILLQVGRIYEITPGLDLMAFN